jgi:hypothetical protein
MVIMGCHILGNLNRPATSIDNIGLPLWRLILAAGILAITFGFFNIVSSIVFRDRKNGITSRNIRSDGSLASGKNSFTDAYSARSLSVKNEKPEKRWTQKFNLKSGRPKISSPIIQQDVEQGNHSEWQDEDRRSPIMPHIQRPNTALHPMNTGHSRYSEASHLPRF